MRSGQIAFSFDETPETEDVPCLYLACPLTSVDATDRQLLDSLCAHIVNTVTETCTQSEDRWDVGVHAPIWWSNPRSGDGRSPEDVYDLNSGKVRDCAGMIVLALGGGSTGVGQELAWAFQLRLPVLYLYPSYGHVSRQIEGSPGDKTVTAFADTSELVDAVRAFLLANRSVIADHARRAKGEATKFAPLRADLLARWHSLTQPDQKRVAGEARLPVRRVEELLGDDTSLGSASLSELAALIGSVGSSFQALAPTQALPELQDRQHDASPSARTSTSGRAARPYASNKPPGWSSHEVACDA